VFLKVSFFDVIVVPGPGEVKEPGATLVVVRLVVVLSRLLYHTSCDWLSFGDDDAF
jgi:hypothetical protein